MQLHFHINSIIFKLLKVYFRQNFYSIIFRVLKSKKNQNTPLIKGRRKNLTKKKKAIIIAVIIAIMVVSFIGGHA